MMKTGSSTFVSMSMVLLSILSCNNAYYEVSIGQGTVVKEGVQIIAEHGPIIIGAANVIGERTKIINRLPTIGQQLVIGDANTFEAQCIIMSPRIGNSNVFKCGCFIGKNVTVTDACVIGPGCRLTNQQIIQRSSVVNC